MRLMRRSHTLGRVDHGTFGGQAGADPTRVVAAMQLPGYDVVRLPLMPGGECSNGRLGPPPGHRGASVWSSLLSSVA